jgi:hypothetical protein
MASINRKIKKLRQSVLACLLWESDFHEDGVYIATRIQDLCKKVNPERIKELAIEADILYGEDGKPYISLKTGISFSWRAIRQLFDVVTELIKTGLDMEGG